MIKGKKKMYSETEAAYQHQHARCRTTNIPNIIELISYVLLRLGENEKKKQQ